MLQSHQKLLFYKSFLSKVSKVFLTEAYFSVVCVFLEFEVSEASYLLTLSLQKHVSSEICLFRSLLLHIFVFWWIFYKQEFVLSRVCPSKSLSFQEFVLSKSLSFQEFVLPRVCPSKSLSFQEFVLPRVCPFNSLFFQKYVLSFFSVYELVLHKIVFLEFVSSSLSEKLKELIYFTSFLHIRYQENWRMIQSHVRQISTNFREFHLAEIAV